MRALLAILVIAVAGGVAWMLTRDDASTPAVPEVPDEKPLELGEQLPALKAHLEPMSAAPDTPVAGAGLSAAELATLRAGSDEAAADLARQSGYTDEVVEALLVRARRLRAEQDEPDASLFIVLRLLAESDHPTADAFLIELVREAEFFVPSYESFTRLEPWHTSRFFRDVLEVSKAPGIAEAALVRVHAADEPLSVNSLDGWSELVVLHGTDHEIWELMRSGYARSPGIYEATMALDVERARAFHDVAAAEARQGINGMTLDAYVVLLQRFAKFHHDVALPIIQGGLLTGTIDGQRLSDRNVRELAQIYGTSEAIADLRAGIAFLARIEDDRRRMNAMAMLQHGYTLRRTDLPSLRPLTEQLLRVFNRAATYTSIELPADPELERAMWVVENVHPLRSAEALGAYRRVAKLIAGAPGERARSLGERLSGHGLTENK